MRTIKELDNYKPIHEIFNIFKDENKAVFLDSSLKNKLGQYSIIGLYPYLELENGEQFKINGEVADCEFETFLKDYLSNNKDINDTNLPIVSGAIGYFSYDYGLEKSNIKSRHTKKIDIPLNIICFYDVFIIENHRTNKIYLVANGQNIDSNLQIEMLIDKINTSSIIEKNTNEYEILVSSNFEKDDYLKSISNMINYIIEGDIYIANMTQQLTVKSDILPYDFFRKLREINPSPFGGYLNYNNFKIISASPERFLQMQNQNVVTRPIKGTRKRGSTLEEDNLLKEELKNSKKDKSELLMIVDLERNDLNKVCVSGSVKVSELFSIEEYSTVFHLVANVSGTLKSGLTVMDLISATFPGGSITGAPKQRAMEIIDELENSRRNLYTGSIGFITLDGDCDFNIVIRSCVYKDNEYHLGVGGGITYESDLEFEYEETMQKAKAILDALKNRK